MSICLGFTIWQGSQIQIEVIFYLKKNHLPLSVSSTAMFQGEWRSGSREQYFGDRGHKYLLLCCWFPNYRSLATFKGLIFALTGNSEGWLLLSIIPLSSFLFFFLLYQLFLFCVLSFQVCTLTPETVGISKYLLNLDLIDSHSFSFISLCFNLLCPQITI